MVAVRIYVEGGGETRRAQEPLRIGFGKLFARVLGERARPKVITCGSRNAAFDDFKRGLKSHPDALCILLVDSEEPVKPGTSTWDHVLRREGDQWLRPDGVSDEQLHLMVQAMEAWLVADPEALAAYYKNGFRRDALPQQKNVEQVAKRDLYDVMERATRDSKTKGKYAKSHAFELIGLVDPHKVRAASAHAARLFNMLAARAEAGPP
ncbi:DUF4276 family protein [Sorangium sp. So ce281]|uniref:DUF4276 family protein n=1 Tax=unclassified Sorangium TaxID=2621164 RepID=UPI003F630FF0